MQRKRPWIHYHDETSTIETLSFRPNSALNDTLLGIDSFAPEFWRLMADTPAPQEPNVSPQFPKLTHEGLQGLRDSLGNRANDLQDIPPPPPPPHDVPKLTNDRLRDLRNADTGSGDMQDIPSRNFPKSGRAEKSYDPEVDQKMALSLNMLEEERSRLERLERERATRTGSAVEAFDGEINAARKRIQGIEAEMGNRIRSLPGYGRT